MAMYGRWNEELNGVSIARDPDPLEDWIEVTPVYPPKDDGQVYVDPAYSISEDHTVVYETWTVEDAPPPEPPPSVLIEVGALQSVVGAVNGMSSLGDAQSYVAGWAAAFGA